MTHADALDALIERLKFHRRCPDGCLDLIAAVDDAAAALDQLRDRNAALEAERDAIKEQK